MGRVLALMGACIALNAIAVTVEVQLGSGSPTRLGLPAANAMLRGLARNTARALEDLKDKSQKARTAENEAKSAQGPQKPAAEEKAEKAREEEKKAYEEWKLLNDNLEAAQKAVDRVDGRWQQKISGEPASGNDFGGIKQESQSQMSRAPAAPGGPRPHPDFLRDGNIRTPQGTLHIPEGMREAYFYDGIRNNWYLGQEYLRGSTFTPANSNVARPYLENFGGRHTWGNFGADPSFSHQLGTAGRISQYLGTQNGAAGGFQSYTRPTAPIGSLQGTGWNYSGNGWYQAPAGAANTLMPAARSRFDLIQSPRIPAGRSAARRIPHEQLASPRCIGTGPDGTRRAWECD